MADLPARLYLGQPGTAATTLYTVSTTVGTYAILRNIHVANTTGTAATITIGINGVAVANAFYFAVSVPANGALDWTGMVPLLGGAAPDTLQALQGTAGALTVVVGGITGP